MKSLFVRQVHWTDRVGVLALAALATFAWLSTSAAAFAIALLVLTFLLAPGALRPLRREPMAALFLLALVYLLAETVWAMHAFPETARQQGAQAGAWFRLWFFVAVAWGLGARLERINWVLGLALAGLIAGMLLDLDWSSFPALLWSPDRNAFRTHPNPFSLYVSTALLGVLVLAPRWWGDRGRKATWAARGLSWLAVSAVLVQWLLSTRSRGAFIAALVVFPAALGVRLIPWLAERPDRRYQRLAAFGLIAALFLGIVGWNFPLLKQRILEDRQTYSLLAAGEFEHLPQSSTTWRFHLYTFGFERWSERPILGWGPATSRHLIQTSGREDLKHPGAHGRWDFLDHLHSTYLEIAVRFGLIGIVFAAALFYLLIRSVWRAYRRGVLPLDYTLFVLGSFGLTAMWCGFDFRLDHPDWLHYWLLLAGIAYTFELRRPQSA